MRSSSRCRGAGFVDYLVLVAAALALVAGALLLYRSAYGQGARCLAVKIAGGGQCAAARGPAEAAPVTAMADLPSATDARCDASGKCTNGACFAEGTPVLTPGGERPIETIAPGDVVVAKDPETGEVSARRVLGTKVTFDRPSIRVTLDADVLVVTPNHPFLVVARGWTAAGDLVPGDRVVTPGPRGSEAEVVALASHVTVEPVYNLEVEDVHTYFVGHAHALVHNDCDITQAAWTRAWTQREAAQVIKAAEDTAAALKQLTSPNQPPSMHAPGFDVQRARLESLANVASRQPGLDTTMAQILASPTSDPAAKRLVAQALSDGKHVPAFAFGGSDFGFGMPLYGRGANPQADLKAWQAVQNAAYAGESLRLAFARYASAGGTPEMKKKAAELLAFGGGAGSTLGANAPYEIMGKKLQYTLERAQKNDADSEWKKLGRLLYVQQLAKDPKLADKVNTSLLDTFLERSWKDPVIAADLAKMHSETMSEVRSSKAFQQQLTMLQSEAFLLRLQLETPDEAKKTLQAEIGKVAAVDAALAKELLDRLVGRQLVADFHALDEDTQAAAVGKSIDLHLAELAKHDHLLKDSVKNGVKAPADVLKRIAKVLKEQQAALAANRSAEAAQAIDKIVEDAAKAGQINPQQQSLLKRVFTGLERSDKHGAVSSVAAVAAMTALALDIYDGEAFKDRDKTLASASTVLKTVNSLESYAKLGAYMRGTKLPEAGRLVTAIKLAKWAGPIADGISVYLDGKSAIQSYNKGYTAEAVCDAGAAGCAGVSAIGGIAIAAGATGPAAPIALLVGTVGYLSFKGIKWLVKDPDEIKAIKEAGVFRDTSGATLAAIHAREIRKYANSCTSDRRNCPGPVGEEARRILDGEKRFPGTFDPFPLLREPPPPGAKLPPTLTTAEREALIKWIREGAPPADAQTTERDRLWRMEANVVAARGAKFYKDHGAPPGSCGKCH